MNLTEKKIIYALDKNSRLPGHKIAKQLRMSPEAVNYNIRKLEERGIITDFITVADFSRLGLTHYKFNLKLSHHNDKIATEIVDFLKKERSVKWIASSEGAFDLMFSVRCRTLSEFDDLKTMLFSKFDSNLNKKSITVVSEAMTFTRGYILNKPKSEFSLYSGAEEIPSSKEDIKILNAISTNCRQSIPELSKKLRITPRIIRYAIKRLEQNKIISGYKLAVNYEKINYLFFKLFISLQSASSQRINSFRQYCRQHPNFTYWVRVVGSWDMEHEIEAQNIQEFYKILKDIRNNFSDIIQTMDFAMITKEYKIVHA